MNSTRLCDFGIGKNGGRFRNRQSVTFSITIAYCISTFLAIDLRLFERIRQCFRVQIIPRLAGHSHTACFYRVLTLPVTSSLGMKSPSIILRRPNHVANLHLRTLRTNLGQRRLGFFSGAEVDAVRMLEHDSGDARLRLHHEAFRQVYADILGFQKLPELGLIL